MEQKEPSMEEILSSIRRILSTEEGVVSNDEDLKSSVSEQALDTKQVPDESEVMDLTPDMLVGREDAPDVDNAPEDMVLLSEATVQASTDKLNSLTRVLAEPEKADFAPAPKAENVSTNLENLVAELLRPYLKEWLDAHLPALVEKVVQKEVGRLVNKVHQE